MTKFEVSFPTETTLDDDSTLEPVSMIPATFESRSLLVSKPTIAIVYLILLVLVSFWGGTSNFLILIVHVMNKKLNKAGRIFLVNLCLADLCVSVVAIPFCIIGVTHGEDFFQERPTLCRFIASFCFSACVCAILNLSMATINRYTYVCHNQIYMRFFDSRTSIIVSVCIWILSILIDAFNILGVGGHIFDRKNHSCIWDRMANFGFTMFVSVGLIIVPLISIIGLNALLMRRIHATKFSICKMRDVPGMRKTHNAWLETIRASRTLFTMCLVFMVCWIPYSTLVALDVYDSYPEEVHLFLTLLAHSHSATNFILYWLCNKEFSKTVYQVFRYLFSCQMPNTLLSSSSSEFSSTSSSSERKSEPQRRQGFCFRRRKPVKRCDSAVSTTVDATRTCNSSMMEKGANALRAAEDNVPIYVLRHCDMDISAVGSGKTGTDCCDQKDVELSPTNSEDQFRFISDENMKSPSRNHRDETKFFNNLNNCLNAKTGKYRISY